MSRGWWPGRQGGQQHRADFLLWGWGFLVRLGLLAVVTVVWLPVARAEEDHVELFSKGAGALREGRYQEAISVFEMLADHGFVHPDVAYDRGLSYLTRVRAHAEQPGDLGRAAAGFEECLVLRGGDAEAEQALDMLRAEVARRRAVGGGPSQVQARPSIEHAIVELAPESVWAACAMAGSIILAAGLMMRRRRHPAVHLTGVVATPIAAVVLVVFGLIAWRARNIRHTTSPAVVVVAEARMLDERGISLPAEPIPEAARVEVLERRGELSLVRHGTRTGWTQAAGLRVLATAAR